MGNALRAGLVQLSVVALLSVSAQADWSVTSGSAERGRHHLLYQSFDQGWDVYAMSQREFDNLYRVWPRESSSLPSQRLTPPHQRRADDRA